MFDFRADLCGDGTVYQPVFIGLALCAAIPVALEKPVPPLAYRTLVAAAAIAIGFDSGPETGSTSVLIKALLGTGIIVIFLVFDIAYYASLAMRKSWPRVGVRVFGSWIIAISLMVLALSLFSSRSQMALQ
jgi:urease accessory protein